MGGKCAVENYTVSFYSHHLKMSVHTLHALLIPRHFAFPSWLSTYPSCFHFIPRGAAPSFPIGKHFTFLSLKTWLHVAPPFLFHNGSCRRQKRHLMSPIWVCKSSGHTFKEKATNFPHHWVDWVLRPAAFFLSSGAKSRSSE